MTTQQTRAKAISRKRSLLMTIRMNKAYNGYSSMANGLSKSDRITAVSDAEKELASLVIPEIVTEVIGYSFCLRNNDYLGSVYLSDFNEALEELLLEPDCEGLTVSDLKYETIEKTL